MDTDCAVQSEQPMGFPTTKLTHPRLPVALIARERLLMNLDAAVIHRLTLLSAAAGWGKTTLLSAWTAKQAPDISVAWVSLDTLDNDPTRFWTAVIAALRTSAPEVGEVALGMLQATQRPPIDVILTTLLNDLAHVPKPVLLILDDYHVIDDSNIHDGMTFLIEHLPAHVHLVVASRVDPELPLARWRVGGELLEIRAADLRFTSDEAATFLTRALDDVLPDEDVHLLERRTEGWAAGLQLAMLALRKRADRHAFVQAFTGSHRHVLDYVQEEILDRQPAHIQRFLLHTAVLPRLNAAVCATLTDEPTSQAQTILASLERNNLFVAPLDEERQWYRAHDLFREVLLARLHATEPELVSHLHQRAAHWHAAHNEWREAIAHALAAQDFVYAADLMERAAPAMWLRGEAQAVHTWVSSLPDAILRQHARFALDAARYFLQALHVVVKAAYVSGQAQVQQTITRVEAVLHSSPDSSEVALLLRRIRLLRAWIEIRPLLSRADTERLRLLAEETETLTVQEEPSWKAMGLAITYWLIESFQGQGGLLISKLQAAKQEAIAVADHSATLSIMLWLAFAYVSDGQLHLAHAEGLEALALTDQLGRHTAATGYFYLLLFVTYYEWNQFNAAWDAVQSTWDIAQTWQQVDLLISAHLFKVDILLHQGDPAAAEQALRQAKALTDQERFAMHLSWVAATRVSYWLATGDITSARTWSQQVNLSVATWTPLRNTELLMLVRVYLAQGQYSRALALLKDFQTKFDKPGATDTTIFFLALHVVALHGDGQLEAARSVLRRLLALASPGEFIRVFVDAGKPMRAMLQNLQDTPDVPTAFVNKLLAAFPQEAPHSRALPLIEPLTPREEEVLRLLVAGASNQEIAAKFVISLATVKKHVGNIFSKLGVQNRVQAITLARDWPGLGSS